MAAIKSCATIVLLLEDAVWQSALPAPYLAVYMPMVRWKVKGDTVAAHTTGYKSLAQILGTTPWWKCQAQGISHTLDTHCHAEGSRFKGSVTCMRGVVHQQ